MTIVPYRGTGPLTNDLLGGHVLVAFNTIPPALGNIQLGNLRAIAVAGAARSSLLPDVPTVIESGLPGFEPRCATAYSHRPERHARSLTASTGNCA